MHWIDPDSLPEITGTIDRYLLNPEGEVDGFVLTDGREVHVPPHMGPDIIGATRTGGAVRVRGVRPRGADVVAAVSVQPEGGARIDDPGPEAHLDARKASREHAHAARRPAEIAGIVRRALHGPKGETRGLLLEDGRIARFPPHHAGALQALLQPGTSVVLRGEQWVGALGTVLALRAAGTSHDDLRPVDAGPDRHGHAKHGPGKHGPGGHGPGRHGARPGKHQPGGHAPA